MPFHFLNHFFFLDWFSFVRSVHLVHLSRSLISHSEGLSMVDRRKGNYKWALVVYILSRQCVLGAFSKATTALNARFLGARFCAFSFFLTQQRASRHLCSFKASHRWLFRCFDHKKMIINSIYESCTVYIHKPKRVWFYNRLVGYITSLYSVYNN